MRNNWKWGKGWRCFSGYSNVRSSDTMRIRTRNKRIETISKWSLFNIGKVHTTRLSEIAMDEYINMSTQAVDIFHHTGSPMNYRELIAQQLLLPTAELVDTPSILQYVLHCDTIANPVKPFPPKVSPTTRDRPSSKSDFTDEGMIMYFKKLVGSRAKEDWSQSRTIKG